MDKAKILRMSNEIEDAVNELAACCEIIDFHTHKMLIDKLREIAAEISKPPKTNGERIRQMTDEELANFACESICSHAECGYYSCETCALQWLRKEADEDAGTDD